MTTKAKNNKQIKNHNGVKELQLLNTAGGNKIEPLWKVIWYHLQMVNGLCTTNSSARKKRNAPHHFTRLL
jgi:hypothetical protein